MWIGFSPTSAQLGAVADTWLSEGGDLIAEFDSVVGGAHTLGGSRMVKAYENAGEAGIVQLSACTRNDGVSWAQVAKADKAWADYMTEHDLPAVAIVGARARAPQKNPRWTSIRCGLQSRLSNTAVLGQVRPNRNAAQDMRAIYGDDNLYTCDKSRIYHGVPVGGSD